MRPPRMDADASHNPLTPEEERVIEHKGTEAPFTGEYYEHFEPGLYLCRRCDAPLYRGSDKFASHCGWPSFDDEIAGAVRRVPDADGRRTEIICATCDGHLGHVFHGERYTPKNTRHCVNSLSIRFQPEADGRYRRAVFASGCFWGTEYQLGRVEGVITTTVGYCGGETENPTYEEVCHGDTGHAEAVEVVYDSERVTYEDLVKVFFETHDPTQVNRQGPDVGEQYRSAVFYLDDSQKETAERVADILRDQGLQVATLIEPAGKFWEAEDYHQDYYDRSGGRPYCHTRVERFDWDAAE